MKRLIGILFALVLLFSMVCTPVSAGTVANFDVTVDFQTELKVGSALPTATVSSVVATGVSVGKDKFSTMHWYVKNPLGSMNIKGVMYDQADGDVFDSSKEYIFVVSFNMGSVLFPCTPPDFTATVNGKDATPDVVAYNAGRIIISATDLLKKETPTPTPAPSTGDTSNIVLMLSMLVLSVGVFTLIARKKAMGR